MSMHSYSLSQKETTSLNKLRIGFTVAAVIVASALSLTIYKMVQFFIVPTFGKDWGGIPTNLISSALLIAGFHKLLDGYLWKKEWFQSLVGMKTMNWSGTYNCVLYTSYDEKLTGYSIKLIIKQTYSNIQITIYSDNSKSESITAHLDNDKKEMLYFYTNDPYNSADQNLNMHSGTVKLSINSSGYLRGDYYTDPRRSRYGYFISKESFKQTNPI